MQNILKFYLFEVASNQILNPQTPKLIFPNGNKFWRFSRSAIIPSVPSLDCMYTPCPVPTLLSLFETSHFSSLWQFAKVRLTNTRQEMMYSCTIESLTEMRKTSATGDYFQVFWLLTIQQSYLFRKYIFKAIEFSLCVITLKIAFTTLKKIKT